MSRPQNYAQVDVDAIERLLALRDEEQEAEQHHGAERVDMELLGRGTGPWRARVRGLEFIIDEPPERAGLDAGPNPLAYFLAGAASCYLSQLMIVSISARVVYEDVRMSARGYFDRRTIGGSFSRFVYDLKVTGDVTPETLIDLASRAEKMCFAHNTLVRAGVALTTNVLLNGEEVSTLVAETDHLPPGVPSVGG